MLLKQHGVVAVVCETQLQKRRRKCCGFVQKQFRVGAAQVVLWQTEFTEAAIFKEHTDTCGFGIMV